MAKPGRSPKPTALKIAAGNPGKRPLNMNEPQPTLGVPPRPDWLDADAIAEWDRIVPELERLKLLTVADLADLSAYCQAWSDYIRAVVAVRKHGETFLGPTGMLKKSPWVGIRTEAAARLHRLADAFGFNPSSRSRVTTASQSEEKGDNDRSRFFGTG